MKCNKIERAGLLLLLMILGFVAYAQAQQRASELPEINFNDVRIVAQAAPAPVQGGPVLAPEQRSPESLPDHTDCASLEPMIKKFSYTLILKGATGGEDFPIIFQYQGCIPYYTSELKNYYRPGTELDFASRDNAYTLTVDIRESIRTATLLLHIDAPGINVGKSAPEEMHTHPYRLDDNDSDTEPGQDTLLGSYSAEPVDGNKLFMAGTLN